MTVSRGHCHIWTRRRGHAGRAVFVRSQLSAFSKLRGLAVDLISSGAVDLVISCRAAGYCGLLLALVTRQRGGSDAVGTLNYPFVLVLGLSWICVQSAAGAGFEKHFEGPYKITITASKRVRVTVKSTYRFPNMVAQEWWVAYPLPPEFPGQPAARGRIRSHRSTGSRARSDRRRQCDAAAARNVALVPQQY